MNFKISSLVVIVILTSIPDGEGRICQHQSRFRRNVRRFGHRVWRSAKRLYRSAKKAYKEHSWWIEPAASLAWGLRKRWDEAVGDLRVLEHKLQDTNEYNAFLADVEKSLQEHFPDLDFSDFADYMNRIAEMSDDDIQDAIESAPPELEDFVDSISQTLLESRIDV